MRRECPRDAFTLIEVLIVVIIMAVLAATIIPQFASSTDDAKSSALVFNLHTIRSQIEMYKIHHLGSYPKSADDFADQMTKKTDADGTVNETSGKYGPYIQGTVPSNPYNSLNTITAVSGKAAAGSSSGWQYDKSTGGFYPGNSEWDYTNDKPK